MGVACRYPGDVGSLDELWTMVKERRNACVEVPLSRWDADALLASVDGPPDAALHAMRFGGVLSDEVLESFSAGLFGISDTEASRMDPTQRLLLKVSYEALMDAGHTLESLRGQQMGVFVGAIGNMQNTEPGDTSSVESLERRSCDYRQRRGQCWREQQYSCDVWRICGH